MPRLPLLCYSGLRCSLALIDLLYFVSVILFFPLFFFVLNGWDGDVPW